MSHYPDKGVEEYDTDDEEIIKDIDHYNSGMKPQDENEDDDNSGKTAIAGLQAPKKPAGGLGALTRKQTSKNKWAGFSNFPVSTQKQLQTLFKKFETMDKKTITIMVIGKFGCGKTSTVQSLLNEKIQQQVQGSDASILVHQRSLQGFNLKFLDTPGITSSMILTRQYLTNIQQYLLANEVDVVLYVDRLDDYRVSESDVELIRNITRYLSAEIWQHTIVCFTHGDMRNSLPINMTQEQWNEHRKTQLIKQIQKSSGVKNLEPPVITVENSGSQISSESIPKSKQCIPDSIQEIVDFIIDKSQDFKLEDKLIKKQSPNRKKLWLIPIAIVLQLALKKFVIDALMEEDTVRGDEDGFYSKGLQARNIRQLRTQRQKKMERALETKKLKKQGGSKYYTQYFDDDQ